MPVRTRTTARAEPPRPDYVVLDAVADAQDGGGVADAGDLRGRLVDAAIGLADPRHRPAELLVELGDAAGAECGARSRQHDAVGVRAQAGRAAPGGRSQQGPVPVKAHGLAAAAADQHEVRILPSAGLRVAEAVRELAVAPGGDREAARSRAGRQRAGRRFQEAPGDVAGRHDVVDEVGTEAEAREPPGVDAPGTAGVGEHQHERAAGLERAQGLLRARIRRMAVVQHAVLVGEDDLVGRGGREETRGGGAGGSLTLSGDTGAFTGPARREQYPAGADDRIARARAHTHIGWPTAGLNKPQGFLIVCFSPGPRGPWDH